MKMIEFELYTIGKDVNTETTITRIMAKTPCIKEIVIATEMRSIITGQSINNIVQDSEIII